jgi:hypothetical protein
MKVRTLKPHQNACGAKVSKEPGDEYDCTERTAKSLIALGLVEDANEKAASAGDAAGGLSAKSKAELQAIAKDAGCEFADSDTKAVLIEKIEAARSDA